MVSLQLAGNAARRELQSANRALAQLAFVDALTGIGNRRALDRDLVPTWEAARAAGVEVSIVSVDVARFKEINDRPGHSDGDEVLRAIHKRLAPRCPAGDAVPRRALTRPEEPRAGKEGDY